MRAEKKMPLRPTPPVVSSQAFHWALFLFGGALVIGAMAYLFWAVAIGFFGWIDLWLKWLVCLIVGIFCLWGGFTQRRRWEAQKHNLKGYDSRLSDLFGSK